MEFGLFGSSALDLWHDGDLQAASCGLSSLCVTAQRVGKEGAIGAEGTSMSFAFASRTGGLQMRSHSEASALLNISVKPNSIVTLPTCPPYPFPTSLTHKLLPCDGLGRIHKVVRFTICLALSMCFMKVGLKNTHPNMNNTTAAKGTCHALV